MKEYLDHILFFLSTKDRVVWVGRKILEIIKFKDCIIKSIIIATDQLSDKTSIPLCLLF